MKLSYLFKIQNIIDNEIREFCQRDGETLDPARLKKTQILALEIKTAELANLTKCYKYPYRSKPIDKKKLIIRYIDCFKFLLSIGNDNHFNISGILDVDSPEPPADLDLVNVFLRLFDLIVALKKQQAEENYLASLATYTEIFRDIIRLGRFLGLTFEESFEYYDRLYRDMQNKSGQPDS